MTEIDHWFIHRPSARDYEAAEALLEVDEPDRVYATVRQPTIIALRDLGWKRLPKTCNSFSKWILRKRTSYKDYGQPDPLHIDHTSRFINRQDGRRMVLTEPYHLDESTLEPLLAFVREHGLDLSIRADISTHFPGSTIAVQVSERGTA